MGIDEELLQQYHRALEELINGNPDVYKAMWSERDDVTLANPFGPVARGRAAVEDRLERAASNYTDGGSWAATRSRSTRRPTLPTSWRSSGSPPELVDRACAAEFMKGAKRQGEPREGTAAASGVAAAALAEDENPFRRAVAEAALLGARVREHERFAGAVDGAVPRPTTTHARTRPRP
jgi:hypothetical protein